MRDPFATRDSAACDGCPLVLLDEYMATGSGRLISQAIDLDFALQVGVSISLSDIRYPEFVLLRYLSEERNRYQSEAQERPKEPSGHGR